MKNLILLLSLIIFVSCAKKNAADADAAEGVELADVDEFLEEGDDLNLEEGEDDFGADSGDLADSGDVFEDEEAVTNELASNDELEMNDSFDDGNDLMVSNMSGEEQVYSVKKNETLMMIAFKMYGDYSKWREIQQLNPNVDPNNLAAGTKIRYSAPSQPFVWNPSGNPYLIKKGDTLGSISTDTYGAKKYWRDIFENNKPLIKDPHIIFAGFTIYTPVLEQRDVAGSI